MQHLAILGCRVDAVDGAGAVARIAELAQGSGGALVVTLGVEMVMAAQRNPRFRDIVNGADLVTCDTIGLLLASRARGGPLHERVTGVELVDALAARSAERGDIRLYLFGAGGDTAERAARALERKFPGVIILGARNGFFSDEESPAIAAAIKASGANVVCAGLGSPKQEIWLQRYAAAAGCVGIGVGGSFDVFAGNVQRAPRIVQRIGMEWAYRLAREPRRWRRQLALPRFAFAAAKEILFKSRERRMP
ncbi:MAG: WecB/TagA/CpsF family glycosyltransferase [Candidatus Velthaea sp.]